MISIMIIKNFVKAFAKYKRIFSDFYTVWDNIKNLH